MQNVPRMVRVVLPIRNGVLKPGQIRPALPTSIADPNTGALNLVVFLETGDVQGKNTGDTFFAAAVPFTEGDLSPNATGKWFDPMM